MKLLVIGANGYFGSVLTPYLVKKNWGRVVALSRFSHAFNLGNICHYRNFSILHEDVDDLVFKEKLIQSFDIIVWLIPLKYPALSLMAASMHNSQTLIYASSNVADRKGSFYSETKRNCEEAVSDLENGISLRFASMYGVSPAMRYDLIVNDFVRKALYDGYIVLEKADELRSLIHVRDAAWAVINIIEKGIAAPEMAIESDIISKRHLAQKIQVRLPNLYIHERSGEVFDQPQPSLSTMPFEYRYSLEDGIKELIKAYEI